MYAKIFWILCAATLAASALFAVTGTFTPMVGVVLGFWAFGLIFMGMISVLPSTIGHHTPAAPAKAGPNRLEAVMGSTSQAIRNIGSDLAASSAVGVSKAKLH